MSLRFWCVYRLALTQDSCRALGVFPTPLWGGVRGGGSCYFAGYVREHTVGIRRVAPIAACGACSLRLRLVSPAARRRRTCHGVLTATPTPNPSPQGSEFTHGSIISISYLASAKGMRRSTRLSTAWLDGHPPRATRQRDIEFLLFTARCRILDEPTAPRCVGKSERPMAFATWRTDARNRCQMDRGSGLRAET